jgi:hypothetical protein
VEQETIRARRIELYDDQGQRRLALEGGDDTTSPGIVVVGPPGPGGDPTSTAILLVGQDNGLPYFALHSYDGAIVVITFGEAGQPRIALRDAEGRTRSIEQPPGADG